MKKSPVLAANLAIPAIPAFPANLAVLAILTTAWTGAAVAAAQPPPAGEVVLLSLDHATGALSLSLPGRSPRPVSSGDTVAVPAGVPVAVVVTGTNTALYSYSLAAEKGDAPQLDSLNRFLSAAAPFLVDIPRTLIQSQGPDDDPSQAVLREIDDALFGPSGVHRTYLAVEGALRKMSASGGDVLAAAGSLKVSLPPGWDSNVDRLLDAYRRLGSSAGERKALQDSAKVLEAARRVEGLAATLLAARPEHRFPPFGLAWNESRTLRIRVSPSRDPTLGDFATLPARAADVVLAPLWPLRVGVGASFLFSPGSTWEGPSGVEDARFTWGLTLSLAPRALTPASLAAKGWALWLPEITLNPSSADRALGAGMAVGWKALKLGAGALWTRHDTVEGNQSYGAPRLYLSLSVTGWEPFRSD